MDFRSLAARIVMEEITSANNSSVTGSALDDLVGDRFDLRNLVAQLADYGGNVARKTKSWLADGDNESISTSQLQDVIGDDKIDAFAKKLGIGRDEACAGLSRILPELIDKSSMGGVLIGPIDHSKGRGLARFASRFFG